MHGSSAAVSGEFAIVPPFLGSSQRLLNRDHYSVYYKVQIMSYLSMYVRLLRLPIGWKCRARLV